VLAGELTAHAGMIEAGFRKRGKPQRMSALQLLKKAWERATPEEREIFRREIGALGV
jgi:hypothetical protein